MGFNSSTTTSRNKSVRLSQRQQQPEQQPLTRRLASSSSEKLVSDREAYSRLNAPTDSSTNNSSSAKLSSCSSSYKKKKPSTSFLGSPPRSDYPARSFNNFPKLPSSPSTSSSSSHTNSNGHDLNPFKPYSSMKELEKNLADLRSENFDLKLRIYHMEMQMVKSLEKNSLHRENCRLKSDLEEISVEVKKLEDLVYLSWSQPITRKMKTISRAVQTEFVDNDVLSESKNNSKPNDLTVSPVFSSISSYLTANEDNASPKNLFANIGAASPIALPITDESIPLSPVNDNCCGSQQEEVSSSAHMVRTMPLALSTSPSSACIAKKEQHQCVIVGESKDIQKSKKLMELWLDQNVQYYEPNRKLETLSL